ncbi:indole-3-glycerol phosphate synthase TrpC [Pedobacter sp. MC2016-24]|uniref:indole-3-glycerol phosphate synthase TrpC n=1 Tax=Pedobacter sp. MC2016-24 TaxID=2780090 RepID=UPI00187FC8E9|nr:indole-3-glycerol phosphate synthase TrpC [Pedobacter sp. MC2016-24]MBE9600531.1 indole-3-glycerol phosphate synthase TrpC [Pedobacter sp. MC2016-24]
MNILDKIVLRKREEIALAKQQVSIKQLEAALYFNRVPYVFADFLLDENRAGIIAEFKRQSPSKGIINDKVTVEEVTTGYAAAGASALSVLTDTDFFGGHTNDLLAARAANQIPILRKDFMIDPYQILEAKAMGADIILLIAAILTPDEIEDLTVLAKSLGLNVLLEVHNLDELQRSVIPELDAIGVNNRNLADFSVNIQTSFDLVDEIPDDFLKISESAISDPQTINDLKSVGFDGFLIGENFMKTQNPGASMADFVSQLISV